MDSQHDKQKRRSKGLRLKEYMHNSNFTPLQLSKILCMKKSTLKAILSEYNGISNNVAILIREYLPVFDSNYILGEDFVEDKSPIKTVKDRYLTDIILSEEERMIIKRIRKLPEFKPTLIELLDFKIRQNKKQHGV